MQVKPIIFLGWQSQQRLFKRALDGAQYFPAGLFLFRPLLLFDEP